MILDLCGGTGAWGRPYARNGSLYEVVVVDPEGEGEGVLKETVEEFAERPLGPGIIHGILAAPPCEDFASSGARWWKEKGSVLPALQTVFACLDIIERCEPEWWALENPVGRLVRFIGPWKMTFNPRDYGDPWLKKTCLWGEFNMPEKVPVDLDPFKMDKITHMPGGKDQGKLRSVTPRGFAKAFFEANP